ncbi:hypothetical protein G3V82_23840, partial [Escherichia coli]|nr:hypothetical protein [Escherichia coli]
MGEDGACRLRERVFDTRVEPVRRRRKVPPSRPKHAKPLECAIKALQQWAAFTARSALNSEALMARTLEQERQALEEEERRLAERREQLAKRERDEAIRTIEKAGLLRLPASRLEALTKR